MAKKVKKFTPLLIVLLGIFIMFILVVSKKKPERHEIKTVGTLVEVYEAELTDMPISIEGYGSVVPRYEVAIQPQVGGRVEWVNPEFIAGGVFKKGEILFRIEQQDYILAVHQAEASVAQAEYQLELSEANAGIALREWELMNSNGGLLGSEDNATRNRTPDPLVLHEPQMKQAKATLASAQATLEKAKLSLERTLIRAPYNCRVRQSSLSPGQLVSSAMSVASVYNTDIVEVKVSIAQSDIYQMEIPGAEASIILDTGSDKYIWNGKVDRSVGVLDEVGRLEQIYIRVENAYDDQQNGSVDLSIGSFVNVKIQGNEHKNVIAIPRKALREDNTVWLANGKDKLEIKNVSVSHLTPEIAMISSGISEYSKIITSPVSGAANGMKLRVQSEKGPQKDSTLASDSGRE